MSTVMAGSGTATEIVFTGEFVLDPFGFVAANKPRTRAEIRKLEHDIHRNLEQFFALLLAARVDWSVAWIKTRRNGVRVSQWSKTRGIVRAEGIGL